MIEESTKRKRKPSVIALINIGVIVIGMAVIYFGFTFALSTDTPFYVVSSGSMIPTLEVGDIIVVNGGIDFNDVNVGDIIVFDEPRSGLKVIVHRVKEIHYSPSRSIVTKGDHNLASDDWYVTDKEFLGGVIFTIPRVGYLTTALTPPTNYVLIIIVISLVFILEVRNNQNKNEPDGVIEIPSGTEVSNDLYNNPSETEENDDDNTVSS